MQAKAVVLAMDSASQSFTTRTHSISVARLLGVISLQPLFAEGAVPLATRQSQLEELVAMDGPLNELFTSRHLLSSFLAVTHLDDVLMDSSSPPNDKTEGSDPLQVRGAQHVRIL